MNIIRDFFLWIANTDDKQISLVCFFFGAFALICACISFVLGEPTINIVSDYTINMTYVKTTSTTLYGIGFLICGVFLIWRGFVHRPKPWRRVR